MNGPPIAILANLAFFAFALVAFQRLSRASAAAVVVLAGSLLLPEFTLLRLRGFPSIDKERVTYLAALLGLMVYRPRSLGQAKPGFGLDAVLVLVFIANICTVAVNPDPMFNEEAWQRGLSGRWLIGQTLEDALVFVLPLVVGRAAFRDAQDLRTLVSALVGAGLIYSGLIAIEVLMSIPFRVFQLSHVIYGIPVRPQFRYGFTQPVVFMDNGLAVATYMAVALIAAVALRKARSKVSWMGVKRVSPILLGGLLATFNVAGSLYGLAMSAMTALFRPARMALIALLLATFTCVYPTLRMADVFPDTVLVEFAAKYDPDRARSLNGRFEEEDFVLGNIGERLWFGWGHFARIPGAYSFGQGETGLDGWWVIRTGMSGIVGLELAYLFMLAPVFVGWRRMRRLRSKEAEVLLAALLLCIAVRMVDLLINGWWNCLPVFLAGAVLGVTSPGQRGAPTRQPTNPIIERPVG